MPRQRSPKRDLAYQLWLNSERKKKLKDIAVEIGVSETQVRKWKNQDKWNSNVTNDAKGNVTKRGGAPKGNKNAVGNSGGAAPNRNNNAEKFGFFRKYLPEETVSIIQEMPKDPLDILWDQIQLAYAAIVRAQSIMYVKDKDDVTTSKIGEGSSDTGYSEKWEVQQAWDKQGNFLQAQARAQKTLESLIRRYDDMLHKNWNLASEEQKARLEHIKASTAKIKGEDPNAGTEDDGFLEALKGEAAESWQE